MAHRKHLVAIDLDSPFVLLVVEVLVGPALAGAGGCWFLSHFFGGGLLQSGFNRIVGFLVRVNYYLMFTVTLSLLWGSSCGSSWALEHFRFGFGLRRAGFRRRFP